MDTLFSNITAVTMADRLPVILGAYVGVTGGKISYISQKPPEEHADRIIDGRGMVLMPGLINCHAHLPMTPLRGYGDDHNLTDWLNNYIFPKEDLWDERAIRAATLLGLAEMLRFGTTSVSDMYYFSDTVCQCVSEVGIKGNIARSVTVFEDDYCFDKHGPSQELVALKEKWHGFDNGRIQVEASIHAEYTSFDKVWQGLAEYAINEGIGMQVHVSETQNEHESCLEKYGLTPAQILDVYHVWDTRSVAAHCVWLTEEDMDLLTDFIDTFDIDRLGAFAFSDEEGTASYTMDGRVDEDVRISRRDRVMEHQLAVSERLNAKKTGKTYEVIIDEVIGDGLYSGRTRYDAPEIDCAVTVSSDIVHRPGDIIKVQITDAFEYDLEGSEII